MSTIEHRIEVEVPVSTAFNQWTQFETFPEFMDGIESVQQLDDKRLHWKARIAGKEKEWDAEITEQVPDQKIAWRSTSGATNNGVVTFQAADGKTQGTLSMEVEPEGVVENVGDALGVDNRRVERDLERFKQFIERRGQETGAWRGEINPGQGAGV
jgi:uncharacterized membrane protein